MEKQEIYDVVIIGGGPGGLTAAVYASRSNLKTVFIEKGAPGGKMVKTNLIENWSGDEKIAGHALAMRMLNHTKAVGATYKYGEVTKVNSINEFEKEIELASGEIVKGRSVIIATGMVEKHLVGPENIENYYDKGISFCAICDGPLFKGENMIVIGGGNSALEEATYLSSIAKHVSVLIRKPQPRAEAIIQEQLAKKENVDIITNAVLLGVYGDGKVESVKIKVKDEVKELEVSALFPYIGQIPITNFVKHLNVTNEGGFIETDDYMETSVKGVYAIGDVREKHIRQIVTASADGAIVGKILGNRL